MTFGKRLKAARKFAELNQLQLADKSGVTQQTISKIERDKQGPTKFTVQLARACGVRPEWLATEDGEMTDTGSRAHHARQDQPRYEALSPVALDIARAWSKLPLVMQNLYRDSIFRDAAVEKLLNGFKVARPTSASYDAFEKSVEHSWEKHRRQLKLNLEG